MNALAELNRLPETKSEQESFVNMAIGEILEEQNPLTIDVKLKILEDTIKKIRTDVRVKNLLIEEIEKYGKEGVNVNGADIKLSQRKTIDFSNDNECVRLKAELKARETLLKETGAIPETGESLITKHSEFISIKY